MHAKLKQWKRRRKVQGSFVVRHLHLLKYLVHEGCSSEYHFHERCLLHAYVVLIPSWPFPCNVSRPASVKAFKK